MNTIIERTTGVTDGNIVSYEVVSLILIKQHITTKKYLPSSINKDTSVRESGFVNNFRSFVDHKSIS